MEDENSREENDTNDDLDVTNEENVLEEEPPETQNSEESQPPLVESTEDMQVEGESNTEDTLPSASENIDESLPQEEGFETTEATVVEATATTVPEEVQIETTEAEEDELDANEDEIPYDEGIPADGEPTKVVAASLDRYEDKRGGGSKDKKRKSIAADFYYNYEEHVSKAIITEDSGLPLDLLIMDHSYGYDCKKRANLYVLDSTTIMFIAGNVVQITDVNTREHRYVRSTGGGGIGAIGVHPSHKLFVVAEKGTSPNINVYEYPSLKLYRILRGGTSKAYSYVDFNSDGSLLASVGADPDYMLTVWNWRQERTMLRSKAFSQDVFRVTFSNDLEGQLTSSGTGHIRFWKMASTFTGLKLQGQLGKFGKTEISDIEGYVELPDGKVLSGCEWGNMLVWDGGLIKVEITRKGRKPCHTGPIQQIIMDEGELITIGIDGYIRSWDFETIDTADAADDTGIYEMEPMNELKVSQTGVVQLKAVCKIGDQEEPTLWFAQDARGAVWKLDLSFSFTSNEPERIMRFHSGPITGCSASPVSQLVATIGLDNYIWVYDYIEMHQVCCSKYKTAGTSVLWLTNYVDPKAQTILAGFRDGVVRVLVFQKKDLGPDAYVHGGRRKDEDTAELILKQALKPHNLDVTVMAIDAAGEILATGSKDCSVFFFHLSLESIEPIGMVRTPSGVTNFEWSSGLYERNTLLVSCSAGDVLEIEAPEPGAFDTSRSYELKGLKIRTHKFKSVKSTIQHEEEMARKAKEEEERKKKAQEERQRLIERGLILEDDPEEVNEGPSVQDEPWTPYIPEEASAVLAATQASEPGKFWVSMDGYDAGYLYKCEFLSEEEKKYVPPDKLYHPLIVQVSPDGSQAPITCWTKSQSGNYLFIGMQNGMIRVAPLNSNDLDQLGAMWTLACHDNNIGAITHIEVSFDDKYVFTSGQDGNFFSFKFMDQGEIQERIEEHKARIPSAKKELEGKIIDDIDDPKAYSIEDAKQKAEYDKMIREAEKKKDSVRQTISQMRDKFRKLIERNNELPQELQLERKEFEMDPEIKKELDRQTKEKIDLVYKEMAWEEERCHLLLEKISKKFKDMIECERITVLSFLTKHEVCTYRAIRLADDFYLLKSNLENKKVTTLYKDTEKQFTLMQDKSKDMKRDRETLFSNQLKPDSMPPAAKLTTTLKGALGERITKAFYKVEEKKRKRAFRRQQWAQLHANKPSEDYEDPEDLRAIQLARENMGDYKLKSGDNYVVPEHMRLNTDKARSKLLLLKEMVHDYKYNFNQKVLAMRDKKIKIIENIREMRRHLRAIQERLGPEHAITLPEQPQMMPIEMPERRFEYTRETLLEFKEQMDKAKKNPSQGAVLGVQFAVTAHDSVDKVDAEGQTQSRVESAHGIVIGSVSAEIQALAELAPNAGPMELSRLEQQVRDVEETRILYERDHLINSIMLIQKNFDAELRQLRHEKFLLDVILKNADLREVTLYEEYLLLKDFEKQENIITAKVETKDREKFEQQVKMSDVQSKLDTKKKDIEKLQEKEKALYSTFQASLGENNKFVDYLTKVFKKKIKRAKKKGDDEEDDDESDESSDDDSDLSESDDASDMEAPQFDLDVCPAGCDQAMYDNTCALREKRLDIEDDMAEEKKSRDTLNKELETLQRKAKIIDNQLRQAEKELEEFQMEKQRKLNELDIVVALRLHQIQYVLNNVLPQDLTQCLVFEQPRLGRLSKRIKELEHEKALQKKHMKESRRKHVDLIKEGKIMEKRIKDMMADADKMMVDKFGSIIDLEKLEQITVNRQVEELKDKLRLAEMSCSSESYKWDERIKELRKDVIVQTKENTVKMEEFLTIQTAKWGYEHELEDRQHKLGDEYGGIRQADLNERHRLVQLVHLQAQEIDALKEEIGLLSRKGGHILPPAHPPMPSSPTRSIPAIMPGNTNQGESMN